MTTRESITNNQGPQTDNQGAPWPLTNDQEAQGPLTNNQEAPGPLTENQGTPKPLNDNQGASLVPDPRSLWTKGLGLGAP